MDNVIYIIYRIALVAFVMCYLQCHVYRLQSFGPAVSTSPSMSSPPMPPAGSPSGRFVMDEVSAPPPPPIYEGQ